MQRFTRLARPLAKLTKSGQMPKVAKFHFASTFPRSQSFKNLQRFTRSFAVETEPLESLGDSITTAVLLSWNKQAGDSVHEDDVIAVVETDKVTMDIRAKKTGVFVEGLVDEQGEISVGSDLYKIDTSATPAAAAPETGTASPAASTAAASSAPAKDPVTIFVPVMGESITTGVLAQWTVAAGDFVDTDQVVAILETDKVNVEVQCPESGTMQSMHAEEGDEVNVGDPLYVLVPGKGAATKPAAVAAESAATSSADAPAPAAAAPKPVTATPKPADTAPVTKPASTGDRSETRVKMSRMRSRISQRLKESQNTAAALTTFQEVDMGYLMDMRKTHKEEFEKIHGVKLGFMSAFVKASSAALQEIPAINAVIDEETNEVVYRNYVDVSVAVASPSGLVVPVLRNTEKMGFADVEKAIAEYGRKAKAGTLSLEEMTGGTFTISNGGTFGSLYGTPIINQPQSAILGMHATKMRAVVNKEGQVVARPMMYLALTYDHRLIDGREAVTFLKSIQNKIEDPHRLLLSL